MTATGNSWMEGSATLAENLWRGGIDDWLRQGGVVVTANARAARFLRAEHSRKRLAEGLSAWATPAIEDWESWTRRVWAEMEMPAEASASAPQSAANALILSPLQERALWRRVIRDSAQSGSLLYLGPSLGRLAGLAAEAYRRIAGYAPLYCEARRRAGWAGDAAVFSDWMALFDAQCEREGLLSESALPLRLSAMTACLPARRAPVLLVGFDRILPAQRLLLDAWHGDLDARWQVAGAEMAALADPALGEHAAARRFFLAESERGELVACARWVKESLAADAKARLLVVTTAQRERRGELERVFREALSSLMPTSPEFQGSSAQVEFSLGMPLRQVAIARAALMTLRWLASASLSGSDAKQAPVLTESELDWLFAGGYLAGSAAETVALQQHMLAIRRRGGQRLEWSLTDLLPSDGHERSPHGEQVETSADRPLPDEATRQSLARGALGPGSLGPGSLGWRLRQASHLLEAFERGREDTSALEWAELVPHLLRAAGWPGSRPLTSIEYQARERWELLLEACGAVGLLGDAMSWPEFLATLDEAMEEAIFAPESGDAAIQVCGPLEAAGQRADGVWFLGANEDAWPANGARHPLLPALVQREAGMPGSSPVADWNLAYAATERLAASAGEIVFSFARQSGGLEHRPSRLIEILAGPPTALPGRWLETPLPADQIAPQFPPSQYPTPQLAPKTVPFEDGEDIPYPHATVSGGARVLSSQSLCGFQAFATTRLGAEGWSAAEPGLSARQRGQLLHAALDAVWDKANGGLGSLDDLLAQQDLGVLVEGMVRRVFDRIQGDRIQGDRIMVDRIMGNPPIGPGAGRMWDLGGRMPARYLELEQSRLTSLIVDWLGYEAGRQRFWVKQTERDQTLSVAGLALRARPDRLDELQDGSVLVVDYKSGDVSAKAWSGERPDDVQLPLYACYGTGSGSGARRQGESSAEWAAGRLEQNHHGCAQGQRSEESISPGNRHPAGDSSGRGSGDFALGGLVFAKVRAGTAEKGKMGFEGRVFDAAANLRADLGASSRLVKDPLTLEQLAQWREVIERLAREFLSGAAEADPKSYPKTCQACGLQAICRIEDRRQALRGEGLAPLAEADADEWPGSGDGEVGFD